jgi:hypothetical protein
MKKKGREVFKPRSSLRGATMEKSERTRLEKLLGMLGSSFDGERANAARMIAAIAEAKKITINELIAMAHQPAAGSRQQRAKSPRPEPDDDFNGVDKPDDLLRMLKRIVDKPALAARAFTAWEVQFATDVRARYAHDYELSEKQLVITEKILRKASRVFP